MLMHNIVCSNIRIAELKLKRIGLSKERMLKNKPFIFNKRKLKEWQDEFDKLEKEEELIQEELESAYTELEEYI